jgi:hypothetical protein
MPITLESIMSFRFSNILFFSAEVNAMGMTVISYKKPKNNNYCCI